MTFGKFSLKSLRAGLTGRHGVFFVPAHVVGAYKRYPLIAFYLIWLGCAAIGVTLPHMVAVVDLVDNWLSDLRLATIGAVMEPRSDIVLFTITEDTLARHPYRFPIDRAMLADALDRFNQAGVRAIGLDILFDQSTEPDKDRRLAEAVSASTAPVIVGWASESEALTAKQVAYLKSYLPDAIHAPSNLTKDSGDGTVRWVFPGLEDEGEYRTAFAPALAQAAGIDVPRETANLYYRRGPDGSVQPFRKFPLHLLHDLPKQWFAGKIVLIGADLPNEDRHRTPFSAVVGNDQGSLPGVVIHAFALAQLLDQVGFSKSGQAFDSIVALAVSGAGVAIALLELGLLAKLLLGGLALLLIWAGGFGLFALGGALMPLFSPTLTFVAAIGFGVALMAQRYRQKKQHAEAMVQRRNQSLHKMVENSFDGIIITTSDGVVVSANSSADFMMGWSPGDATGSRITDHIPRADEIGSHFLDLDGNMRPQTTENTEPLEIDCTRRDGTTFTMELLVYTARMSFVDDDIAEISGERVSNIYSFRDVTARRLAQEAREQALHEAEAANRAKTEFLTNMSHELRTPLNAIIGFSELMKTEAFGPLGSPQYLDYIKDINNSGNNLIQIINDILDMSKIETGELVPNEELCDFTLIAENCIVLMADRARKGAVKLVSTVPPDLLQLHADERMIKQMLINLLSNGVKFTPTGGTITLGAVIDEDGLVFSVSDTGCGIPADKMAVILEPFGQADMSLQRNYEGTGLGLPLVKAMAELHGGTLDIQSTEGEGTVASVRLPSRRLARELKIA